MKKPVVVGLLGGIGSGKTIAADMLREFGAEGVCLDTLAKGLLKDAGIKDRIVKAFGSDVLSATGRIDRRKLAEKAFSGRRKVKALEAIIHPAVIMKTIERLNATPAGKVFVIDAPLVLESGLHHLCDFLVFVDARKSVRLKRAQESRGWGEEEIKRRERFQKSLGAKKRAADFIVKNEGSLTALKKRMKSIYGKVKGKGLR
jgi:dephospho-CoA kinase